MVSRSSEGVEKRAAPFLKVAHGAWPDATAPVAVRETYRIDYHLCQISRDFLTHIVAVSPSDGFFGNVGNHAARYSETITT